MQNFSTTLLPTEAERIAFCYVNWDEINRSYINSIIEKTLRQMNIIPEKLMVDWVGVVVSPVTTNKGTIMVRVSSHGLIFSTAKEEIHVFEEEPSF